MAVKKTAKKKKYSKKATTKIKKVMREYGEGKLTSGKKRTKVKSRKQAVAIALSEARERGYKVPAKKSSASKTKSKKTTTKKRSTAKRSTATTARKGTVAAKKTKAKTRAVTKAKTTATRKKSAANYKSTATKRATRGSIEGRTHSEDAWNRMSSGRNAAEYHMTGAQKSAKKVTSKKANSGMNNHISMNNASKKASNPSMSSRNSNDSMRSRNTANTRKTETHWPTSPRTLSEYKTKQTGNSMGSGKKGSAPSYDLMKAKKGSNGNGNGNGPISKRRYDIDNDMDMHKKMCTKQCNYCCHHDDDDGDDE